MDPSDLEHRFAFHKANETTGPIHSEIRHILFGTAERIDLLLPDGREKSLVMTNLEQAMFWANASIARTSGGDEA